MLHADPGIEKVNRSPGISCHVQPLIYLRGNERKINHRSKTFSSLPIVRSAKTPCFLSPKDELPLPPRRGKHPLWHRNDGKREAQSNKEVDAEYVIPTA